MPGAAFIHAACFAVGAVAGGATIAVLNSRKLQTTLPPPPSTVGHTPSAPVLQVGQSGLPDLAKALQPIPGTILKYGSPGPISDLIVRKAYVAAYDRRLRHPAWTAEHLTLASLGKSLIEPPPEVSGDRVNSAFREDDSVPSTFRAKIQDYFKSGYDRGHMVPAADAKMSQEAMNETFYLTNIAPQVGDGFNRHYWAYVEDWCRRLTKSFQDVYVFTIPLYLPKLEADGKWRVNYEVIGNPPNVAVPTHFAKVVLASRPSSPSTPHIPDISTGAFVLPNAAIADGESLEKFIMPVDAVERAAGLTLFSEEIKKGSKHICQSTKCEVIVHRFDDAQKKIRPPPRRSNTTP